MGLFDVFGKGGGDLSFELPSAQARCGETFAGIAVFTAGKRAQKIEGLQVWFVESSQGGEAMLHAPEKLPLADTIQPGEVKKYPFTVRVPKASQTFVNGTPQKRFGLRASLDIPKEIDPQAKADLALEGTLDAQVTAGPGMASH